MVELRREGVPSVPVGSGGRDLVVLGVIDWSSRQQRPQMLSVAMATRGWRVLYIDPTPYVFGRGDAVIVGADRGVLLGRLRYRALRREDPHLMSMGAARVAAFSAGVASLAAAAGMRSPVVLVQHPYWALALRGLLRRALVYDCMDLHGAFVDPFCSGFPAPERQLIADADVVTVTSAGLQRLAERIRPCTLIRNACDPDTFLSLGPPPAGGRPMVVYIGAISQWFDAALVLAIARAMPDFDIHLVGSPRGCDVSKLERMRNVRIAGEVGYRELPAHLARASVGIIPFRTNQLTRMTDPVKAYEYLAAGRPVVSSIPFETEGLPAPLVQRPAPTVDAWARSIRSALAVASDPAAAQAARAFAAAHSWTHRAAELEQAIVGDPRWVAPEVRLAPR